VSQGHTSAGGALTVTAWSVLQRSGPTWSSRPTAAACRSWPSGVCSRANYHTTKNKRTMTEKFVIKKFCPSCRKHQEHKEGKISKG